MSRQPEPERILQSATTHSVSTCSQLPTKGEKEALTTRDCEAILYGSQSTDGSHDREEVEKQQVKPGTAPEDNYDSVTTALYEVIADKVKSQVSNALATIPDMMEDAVEQLLHAAKLKAQERICTVICVAGEHVIFTQI